MLVLTRKRGQSIVLGDDVEVTILEVNGEGVKVGITAPIHVKVYRRELYEEIKSTNINSIVKDKKSFEKFLKK